MSKSKKIIFFPPRLLLLLAKRKTKEYNSCIMELKNENINEIEIAVAEREREQFKKMTMPWIVCVTVENGNVKIIKK